MLDWSFQGPHKNITKSAAIIGIAQRVRAAGIFRKTIVIDGTTSVIFVKELFDLPIPLLRADAEFKIFFRNGIPILEAMLTTILDKVSPRLGLPCTPS